jgi:hypothetical protein
MAPSGPAADSSSGPAADPPPPRHAAGGLRGRGGRSPAWGPFVPRRPFPRPARVVQEARRAEPRSLPAGPGRAMAGIVAGAATLLLTSACLLQPSDDDQIRALVRRITDAVNRGDVDAAYRLTDLDFRAICPRARYAALVQAARDPAGPRRVQAIDGLVVRHIRAQADVTLVGPSGVVWERLQFVRDGGRWYHYEDAARCGVEAGTATPRDQPSLRPVRARATMAR